VNTTVDGDVARYAAAVRAAFADLPAPDREALLEDIEDHLVEVAAEPGGPLEERLGPPETYAAELRAWAGLPAPGAARRRGASRLRRRLERRWRAALAHPAGRAVAEFLPELRPAWWVLRGYLAVQLASVGLSFLFAHDVTLPVPTILGSQVVGLLAAGAAVVGSVALGRRGTATRRGRRLTFAANAALGLFALVLFGGIGAARVTDEPTYDEYMVSGSYPESLPGLRSDGREISNVHPYDANGKPLKGVQLYDQDGLPLVATHGDNPELESRLPLDANGNTIANRYPREQYQVDPATGERRPVPAPQPQP
jgi:HAAS